MKKIIISLGFVLALTLGANAQVKIKDGTVTSSTTPNSNAILELESNNKGLIYPRVALTSTSSASPLSAHVQGMTVYNTATAGTGTATAVTPGIYYNNGTQWIRATDWLVFGSSTAARNGTPAGNTDSQYVMGRVAVGQNSAATVASTTSGSTVAQQTAMLTVANGDASINGIIIGKGGGQNISSTVVGNNALINNTTGQYNTAVGSGGVLLNNTTGGSNTAVGFAAATGFTGSNNTAVGTFSAYVRQCCIANIIPTTATNYTTSIGSFSCFSAANGNIIGDSNTVIGSYALFSSSGSSTPTGTGNVTIGAFSGDGGIGNDNIIVGTRSSTPISGNNNILIGCNQSTNNGNNQLNIDGAILGINMTGNQGSPKGNIGIAAVPNASYALNVGGNTNVNGNITATGTITPSDRRIKTDVETFTDGLNVITRLKPVTFHYNEKSGYSSAEQQKKHVGFIAQDVEKVAPYMVNTIDDSKGASGLSDKRELDMGALNQLLVNAVQEQQKEIEQLKKEIEALKK